MPELLPRCESESDDDDSEYEYDDDSLFEELTNEKGAVNNAARNITHGGIPRGIKFQERTSAPNRLVNVENLKNLLILT